MHSLYRRMENYNTIVIFGASDLGRLLYNDVASYCTDERKTLCFADNSYKKWQSNSEIMRPSDVAEKYPGALWIIASDRHSQSMAENLRSLNVAEDNIIKDIPNEIHYRKQSAERMKRLAPQGVLSQLEVDIVHHCNLNCAGCSAFSPLVKEPLFADISVFERDMKRLSLLLNGNLTQLLLLGGEPLLNPQIDDFLRIARECFPNTRILIISNGILLPKMPETFWHTCKENDIVISVTRYPIQFDYVSLSSLAAGHDVAFEYFGISVDKTTFNFAIDPLGQNKPYDSFVDCSMANLCVRLKNGKLSTCSPILNIEFFNKHFGTDIKVCSGDYIDIYEAKSGHEILDFLSKPVPFCRYCDVAKRTYDNPWHVSAKNIDEWVASAGNIKSNEGH